jgi:UDP-N-acetylglucosamine--N-acetylmuramyl-(pentapeptide) pyrophosphoryl-undecaprenol N-acetylglucosamine transferase
MGEDEVSEEYLLKIRREKTSRELDRIRNSFSFRSGQIIAKSLKFPLLLPILPFWLLGFIFTYGLERLGKKPAHKVNSGRKIVDPKRCIVFFPTNGVGLGHFTRLFAVAKRVREQDPEVEIVFVTTMAALHLLESEGIPSYHLPGAYMFNDMSSAEWNAITEELLATVFEIHRPSVFVFDGAFPYRGMLNAIKNRQGLTNVWLRRGAFKKGGTKVPVDSIEHFHHILRPGDSVETTVEEIDFSTPVVQLKPIILARPEDLLSREEARLRLGLSMDTTAVYLQLGAGKINDIEGQLDMAIRLLNEHENVHMVVGESIIGDRLKLKGDRVRIIRDYPNSLLFNAFDFAIMAGGYNSYHEAIAFALPTLFIPNLNTGMDDQLARVSVGEVAGACLVLNQNIEKLFSDKIRILLDPNHREKMRSACQSNPSENGAIYASKILIDSF